MRCHTMDTRTSNPVGSITSSETMFDFSFITQGELSTTVTSCCNSLIFVTTPSILHHTRRLHSILLNLLTASRWTSFCYLGWYKHTTAVLMDILQVNFLLSLRSFKFGAVQTRTPATLPRLLCVSWCFILSTITWLIAQCPPQHQCLPSHPCQLQWLLWDSHTDCLSILAPVLQLGIPLHNWTITLLWCHSLWLTIHAMAISHSCRSHSHWT
jgi:hypothetical protein